MILNAYAIFDSAAQAFNTPFYMQNDGMAIRAFSDSVNSQEENNLGKHPEQFTLYKVGEYNDSNGHFKAMEQPKPLIMANEVKQPTESSDIMKQLLELKKLVSLQIPQASIHTIEEKQAK